MDSGPHPEQFVCAVSRKFLMNPWSLGGRSSPGSGAQRRRMQRGQDIHHVKSLKENKGREHVGRGRRSTLCDRLPVDHGRVHKNIYKRVFLFVVFSCNVNENLEVMYRMFICCFFL